ncbi:hypothetical protein B0H14DRAFT_2588342 [Mycena olivaceomarginata]|nr:hypothetical protein B0H14DRAFT_2588342 [Mycena olivaceomarginata]
MPAASGQKLRALEQMEVPDETVWKAELSRLLLPSLLAYLTTNRFSDRTGLPFLPQTTSTNAFTCAPNFRTTDPPFLLMSRELDTATTEVEVEHWKDGSSKDGTDDGTEDGTDDRAGDGGRTDNRTDNNGQWNRGPNP